MEDLSKFRLHASNHSPFNLLDNDGVARVIIVHDKPHGLDSDEDRVRWRSNENLAMEILQRFNNYGHLMRDNVSLLNIIKQAGIEIACRECGCTEAKACPGGCHWVEPDLCSECEDVDGADKG